MHQAPLRVLEDPGDDTARRQGLIDASLLLRGSQSDRSRACLTWFRVPPHPSSGARCRPRRNEPDVVAPRYKASDVIGAVRVDVRAAIDKMAAIDQDCHGLD